MTERGTCERPSTEETQVLDETLESEDNYSCVISERQRKRRYHLNIHRPSADAFYQAWRRFTRHGKPNIGVMQSLRAFAFSSCMYTSLIFSESLKD
jgi:hypothetical protein